MQQIKKYMSQLIHINKEYAAWVQTICTRFRQFQIKTAMRINAGRLEFNWELGREIVELHAEKRYGEGVIKSLSQDLINKLPGIGGLTPLDLYFCRRFYLLYSQMFAKFSQAEKKSEAKKFSQLEKQLLPMHSIATEDTTGDFPVNIFAIPWGHHKVIISKFESDPERALFYAIKTIEHGWSRSMLQNAIAGDLFSTEGKAVNNFVATLPAPESDLACSLIKDPLNLSYIALRQSYKETQLKDALTMQIGRLLMELGRGFAYVGREYLLEIPDKEQSADLLFYNTLLHAYVVVEVKVTTFESADLGQLSGYMSTINHILKTEYDNPTMGILVCQEKNNLYAQYCLEGYNHPIAITAYEGIKILPDNFNEALPIVKDMQSKKKSNFP